MKSNWDFWLCEHPRIQLAWLTLSGFICNRAAVKQLPSLLFFFFFYIKAFAPKEVNQRTKFICHVVFEQLKQVRNTFAGKLSLGSLMEVFFCYNSYRLPFLIIQMNSGRILPSNKQFVNKVDMDNRAEK